MGVVGFKVSLISNSPVGTFESLLTCDATTCCPSTACDGGGEATFLIGLGVGVVGEVTLLALEDVCFFALCLMKGNLRCRFVNENSLRRSEGDWGSWGFRLFSWIISSLVKPWVNSDDSSRVHCVSSRLLQTSNGSATETTFFLLVRESEI